MLSSPLDCGPPYPKRASILDPKSNALFLRPRQKAVLVVVTVVVVVAVVVVVVVIVTVVVLAASLADIVVDHTSL